MANLRASSLLFLFLGLVALQTMAAPMQTLEERSLVFEEPLPDLYVDPTTGDKIVDPVLQVKIIFGDD